jgi:hypothetical protein
MLLCDEWGVLPISDAQDIKLPSHSNDHLTCKLTHLIFQAFCILGGLTLYSVDTKHFLQVQCNRVQGEAIKVSASLHHKPWAITVVIVHVNLFLTHTHTHLHIYTHAKSFTPAPPLLCAFLCLRPLLAWQCTHSALARPGMKKQLPNSTKWQLKAQPDARNGCW